MIRGTMVLMPKEPIDAEDVLTPEEEKIVLEGMRQIRRGQYVTWEKLKQDLDRRVKREARKKKEKGVG